MEISKEMRSELLQGLYNDSNRMSLKIQGLCTGIDHIDYSADYRVLEEMAYLTEEMRLKLKVLGAPKLYN